MTSRDLEGAKARAEERFKKATARATDGAEARAEHDAGVIARDNNTARLKGLRLERDRADREAAASAPAAKKSRSRKPDPKPTVTWGELNIALNALVKAGAIAAYKASRADKDDGPAIEVTTAVGADQAEVVSRVRRSLPVAFSGATIRTRAA